MVPATCLENWDMFTLLKSLQTNVVTDTVKHAAGKILMYTRNDLAHERFDCDWARDWRCMEELLTALGCSSAADDLRKFCEPLNKSHCDKEGDICRTHEYTACAFVACVRAHVRLCSAYVPPVYFIPPLLLRVQVPCCAGLCARTGKCTRTLTRFKKKLIGNQKPFTKQ